MDREEIMRMLEEDVYTIHAEDKEYIDTNNGVLNEGYLRRRKKVLLSNATEYLADEVVTAVQQYPENDVSEVDLKLDAVVMKRRDLEAILKYIEEHE